MYDRPFSTRTPITFFKCSRFESVVLNSCVMYITASCILSIFEAAVPVLLCVCIPRILSCMSLPPEAAYSPLPVLFCSSNSIAIISSDMLKLQFPQTFCVASLSRQHFVSSGSSECRGIDRLFRDMSLHNVPVSAIWQPSLAYCCTSCRFCATLRTWRSIRG